MNLQASNFQRCQCVQRKDKERQGEKEVTEDPKRLTMWEMARGCSLFEKAVHF